MAAILSPSMLAYEDDFLLIIDKPAGMLVHPTVSERGTTLYDYVKAYYEANGIDAGIHPVSRLDRNTSGLVIFAKEPVVQHWLSQQQVEKEYLALACGRFENSEGIIEAPIARKEGSIIERLKQLHLVPLSISYEYDPCDFLKAKEFQQKRDNADWKKGPMDDLVSMQTGIFGYKGHVHYHAAPCLDEYLDSLDPDTPKQELYNKVAAYIDEQIFKNYRLYPGNYVALDLLEGSDAHQAEYTAEEKANFERYMEGQLAKIDLPDKDEAYLEERFLTMYANPARNYLAVNK